jgi:DNA-3-methyladenine glycosylase II
MKIPIQHTHYSKHLSADALLKKLVRQQGPIQLKKRKQVYLRLIESIVSQQLSVKAADTIHGRFLQLYGGQEPTPQQILDTAPEQLRAAGLSWAKATYLHNVARFELEQGMDTGRLHKMSNEEVVTYLTQIKGVGRWTVEMLLMFVLAREDVFAIDDIGIQNAMARLYGLNRKHKRFKKKLLAISQAWSPYRTYACLYLWRWKAA